MSDIIETFDWQKSGAHVFLLSLFYLPKPIDDVVECKDDWDDVLRESPRLAIERFIKLELIAPCLIPDSLLPERLDKLYKRDELRQLLKEKGQLITGNKHQLIDRLIRTDKEGMKSLASVQPLYECTEPAKEIVIDEERRRRANPQEVYLGRKTKKIIGWIADATAAGVVGYFVGKWIEEAITKKKEPSNENDLPIQPHSSLFYETQGDRFLKAGDYQKAIENYTKAIELDPKLALAYHGRGVVYERTGEYQKALAEYTKSIELDPKLALAYHGRGVVYGEMGEYQKAIENYTKAIELDPKYGSAYHNRGVVYEETGEYEDAIRDFVRVLEISSDKDLRYQAQKKLGVKYPYVQSSLQSFLSRRSRSIHKK